MSVVEEKYVKEVEEGLENTLEWNQKMVLSNLLIIEEHLGELEDSEVSHSWCVVKHYLLATFHHCREALGHVERLGRSSTSYKRFYRKLKELNVYPEPRITIPDIVKLRTEWRYIIGDPTLTGECAICETDITPEVKAIIEDIISKLQEKEGEPELEEHMHTHLNPDKYLQMERQLAEEILKDLSEEYGVDPPEIVISNKCHEPNVGSYRNGKIYMCRSGVNLHLLAHEWRHHLQRHSGSHFSESEAESFAVDLFKPKKTLYYKKNHDGNKMMTINDIAVVYGGQHIGQGVERLLEYLDVQYPAGIMGVKASLIGDLLGTVGGVYGAMELDPPYDLLIALIGGHLSTNLWEQAEEFMGLGPVAYGTPSYKYTSAPQKPAAPASSGYTKGSYAVQ